MQKKKILFAGHTGLKKKQVLSKLKTEIEECNAIYKNQVGVYNLEDYIRLYAGEDPRVFPGMPGLRQARRAWKTGWDKMVEEISSENKSCALVSAHLVFCSPARSISPVNLRAIADWRPDVVITLIDEVFSVLARIRAKDYDFALSDLYMWRELEWIMADQVAYLSSSNDPRVPNRVLSVKHPTHMLYRLLFEEKIPVVYSSFPITVTRGSAGKREEINRFRRRIHSLFTVYDPLTIDERVMETWLLNRKGDTIEIDFSSGVQDRWDCGLTGQVSGGDFSPLVWDDDLGVLEIRMDEIEKLHDRVQEQDESLIDHHITYRDYRLLDQSDYVVCYRPYYEGKVQGGVAAEIYYANQTTKESYAYTASDKRPARPLGANPTHSFTNEDDFWKKMESLSKTPFDLRIRNSREY